MHEKQLTTLDYRLQGYFNDKTRYHSISCSPIYWWCCLSYTIGRASTYARGDEKAASKEMTAFLDGLNLDADTRKYISDLATDVFVVEMGII